MTRKDIIIIMERKRKGNVSGLSHVSLHRCGGIFNTNPYKPNVNPYKPNVPPCLVCELLRLAGNHADVPAEFLN